ncbi:MAG: hydroxypyruvate isomerase family protein [Egibacteraceae bacterium]
MRFAANIGFLFTEVPFLERFAGAAGAGFAAVEFTWPFVRLDLVAAAAREAGVQVVQLNCEAGDLAAGDRGYPNDPSRRSEWRGAFLEALHWSEQLDCALVNVLAGNRVEGVNEDVQRTCLEDNLAWALPQARARGVVLLLEVLNDTDTPDYLLTRLSQAVSLLERFDDPNLRLQFDTYHMALNEGTVVEPFKRVASLVGHIQVADAPGRHEPGTGSVDFPAFFRALEDSGYSGAVSLEYLPLSDTVAGLRWLPSQPW